MQFIEIIIPVFIFYPDNERGVDTINQFSGISRAVDRQVNDLVGPGIIFLTSHPLGEKS